MATHVNHQPKPKRTRHSRRFAKQSSTSHGDDSRPRANLVGRNRRGRSTPLPHHDPIRRDPRPEQCPRSTCNPHDQRNSHRTTARARRWHAYRLRCELRQSQSRPQGVPCRPDLRTPATSTRRSMRSSPSRHRLLDRTLQQSFAAPIDGPQIHPNDRVPTSVSVGGLGLTRDAAIWTHPVRFCGLWPTKRPAAVSSGPIECRADASLPLANGLPWGSPDPPVSRPYPGRVSDLCRESEFPWPATRSRKPRNSRDLIGPSICGIVPT